LVIALLGVAVLGGGSGGAEAFAFPCAEQSQFAEAVVVVLGPDKGTGGPSAGAAGEVELPKASERKGKQVVRQIA